MLLLFAPVFGLYQRKSGVVNLTPLNFDSMVLDSDSIWVVEFYAPWCGHCQSLVPEYIKAATALKGIIKVGAINADKHGAYARQYNIQGFPTIKIFGADKDMPRDYTGGHSAKAIVESALKVAENMANRALGGKPSQKSKGKSNSGNDVAVLTDANFDTIVMASKDIWLVEFFAPWCQHCQQLAPKWIEAAKGLKGKIKLGAIDGTVNTQKAEEFGIDAFPTILFFDGGKKSTKWVEKYDSGLNVKDIVEYGLDKYEKNLLPPEVKELVDEDVLSKSCSDDMVLCVISFLPHILDCDMVCRNNYLDILKNVSESHKSFKFGWIWMEGQSQMDIEKALEVGGFGYPALVVISFKKMFYSILRGSFSQPGIKEFLSELMVGKARIVSLNGSKLPAVKLREPWDGQNGKLPEEEGPDELDLLNLDGKDDL